MSVCVQAAQAALLGAASAQQLAVERMVYANMAAQADADARAKVGGSRLDRQVCGWGREIECGRHCDCCAVPCCAVRPLTAGL